MILTHGFIIMLPIQMILRGAKIRTEIRRCGKLEKELNEEQFRLRIVSSPKLLWFCFSTLGDWLMKSLRKRFIDQILESLVPY